MDVLKEMKKGMKKQKKRMTFALSKTKGKMAEVVYESMRPMQGYDVKRKPYGRDYEEQKVDFLTGKPRARKISVEIKTGRAKLSKLQQKTRKKKKGSYRVERF